VSPWTITTAGLYVLPIDGRSPKAVPVPTGLQPDGIVASPDGQSIVFSATDPGGDAYDPTYSIYMIKADGSGFRTLLGGEDTSPFGFTWSRDGRWIAYLQQDAGANLSSVHVIDPDGSERKLFTYPVPGSGMVRWSPDSTRVAVTSGNDGAGLWVVDRVTGASQHVVTEAAGAVDWSPDSQRLAVGLIDGSPPKMGVTERKQNPAIVINADGTGRRQLLDRYSDVVWSPAGDGIALRSGPYLIDPDTLTHRSYGMGTSLAYAADGEHLLATGPGLIINDRRACGFQLVATDFGLTSANFAGWAGTGHILIRVRPPS
jgi:Tol biopolymer transport system component